MCLKSRGLRNKRKLHSSSDNNNDDNSIDSISNNNDNKDDDNNINKAVTSIDTAVAISNVYLAIVTDFDITNLFAIVHRNVRRLVRCYARTDVICNSD